MISYSKAFKAFEKQPIDVPLEIFHNNPYKTLVSTLLSSRTKDETTLEASRRLFRKAPNVHKLKNLKTEELKNLIYPVGFYKTKAGHLKILAEKIIENCSGTIPMTRTDLVKLPGVGRKTANLVLNRAFGKPAIAVDTHVHKISNLLGWVNTKTPEQTETELMRLLPKKYWGQINRLFVSVGRQYPSRHTLKRFLEDNNLLP